MSHLRLVATTALPIVQSTPKGKRAAARTSYLETWAERYHRSQLAIERRRLLLGKARHRAHRDPILGK